LTMRIVEDLSELRELRNDWRRAGQKTGLVPTMGNLHSGHLDLLKSLQPQVDRSVVSLFVNPTQFGPGEDFERYPRTRQSDLEKLEQAGATVAWVPSVDQMYPLSEFFMVHPPASLAGILCGHFRPGHFEGVASVVLRLFNQVSPEVAIFGEKDFQQLLVIRQMVRDLALPLEIQALPTVREPDGLAMSSRNQYLSPDERQAAPLLHQTLTNLADRLGQGESWGRLKEQALSTLRDAGFETQYLAWRCAETLGPPQPEKPQRLLIAAKLGQTRLIDNVVVGRGREGRGERENPAI